jgi:hypothetical protein
LSFRILFASLVLVGCAHNRLSPGDLDRVDRPAFIARVEYEAGPKANVFRADGSYQEKLKRLDPAEADRRLMKKLIAGMSRFEVSERLRSVAFNLLPSEQPWKARIDPAAVASVLQSFLVEEVPANPPDYELLRPLGADSVVEFVIQDYGMRSSNGRAGVYLHGYGRMFLLDGGEIWRRTFHFDQVEAKAEHLDPFRVGKNPELYRQALADQLDAIAAVLAQDLNPPGRTPRQADPAGDDLPTPEKPRGAEGSRKPPDEELPDPDPI